MNGLREKFRNKKGFTLIEMLIVVAIIAILIAVSIPLVGSALEKARDATDQANERAAKAEAAIVYLGVADEALPTTGTFWYNAKDGKLIDSTATGATKPAAYGQCTKKHDTGSYITTGAHTDQIIQVVISDDGAMAISWIDA